MTLSKKYRLVLFEACSVLVMLLLVMVSNLAMLIVDRYIGSRIYTIENYVAIFSTLPGTLIAAVLFIDYFKLVHYQYASKISMLKKSLDFTLAQFITTMAIAYFMRNFAYPRGTIVVGFFVLFLSSFFWSLVAKRWYCQISPQRRILIICLPQCEPAIADLKAQIIRHQAVFNIAEIDHACLISIEYILPQMDHFTDIFIVDGIDHHSATVIIRQARQNEQYVFLSPNIYDLSIKNSATVQFDDRLTLIANHGELTMEQRLFKRLLDIGISVIVLVLTSPIVATSALLIRLSSPGPVIYRQDRVTRDFKVFQMYKLRTMHQDAESLTGPVLASAKDDRIIPVGRVLRRLRLDELPQFVNVLKGDMSVVGPRAERMVFVQDYLQQIDGYDLRFKVKAGITGLAQIQGKYHTPAQNKLQFDLAYINDYSLLNDIRLVLLTVKKLFSWD